MEDAEQPGCSANDGRYEENIYELKLYVICDNQKSQIAFANLKDICDKYLEGKCHIEIIDLKKSPDLARLDQIVAVPTLIRKNYPGKKIVGDLSDQKKVMEVLDLRTPSFTGASNEKGSVQKTPSEGSKAHILRSKRSKDDLQPYIGSDLFRQQSQNLDRWAFSLSHNPC